VPLDPAGVARAIVSIGMGNPQPEATVLGLTSEGLEAV
jgi:hypothetical protein